jgi:hypothetical protein
MDILLRGCGASRQGLGVEDRKGVVADHLSRLVASGGNGLSTGDRGVEALRVGASGSVDFGLGAHGDDDVV